MPGNGRGLRGRSPGPERGLLALRGAPPAAPYFRPCLSRPSAGQLCVRRTAPRKAATARVPKGSAATDTPKPLNFFSAADSAAITNKRRTARERKALSRRPANSPRAPAGPVLQLLPVQSTADPGAARSRPLVAGAPGSCGGGEVAARRRAPPPGGLCARASARTARAEHVAWSRRVRP